MSDNETGADAPENAAPANAAPKKPRARKAASAESAPQTEAATDKPKRKAAPKPAAATPPVDHAPAASDPTPTPNTAVQVSSGAAGAGAAAATHSSGALSAVTDKVSAMIPEDMTTKAKDAAVEVKDMACDAAHGIARIISDSADAIDDNIGPKYGDYARSAAQSVTDAADRLRAKPVEEIAEDTKEFVRNKPVAAAGIAAVFSLVLAKLLSSVFGKRR
ncbi:hypothetical protein [Blastomonas sp. AAP53]|uniref:hypothetical protein n=1 Tax=Blastomonas sp. AAP53 TaxID=1248760 RepID=UPI0002EADEB2|nr:hypothetical protein [Blastomonas sp. AAP53]